ncbi:hypothetical protein [Flavobacterium cerinum]|uniref:DUF4178 domain-containing protein n=1 Tax=Flavobacterium cerinum TaxID=2502784 RepID=A0ABY5IUX8_9FLAO|nr:hypothetical protein [Flavobacterium cerinum]UUC45967.1 hypothetical protein NOX80_01895 [Flavobacterium cerinum]
MTKKEQNYYAKIKSDLIGQKIKRVFYDELHYATDDHFWEHSDSIHSVDMNILLEFENGKICQIKWDDTFYCYGIGFTILSDLEENKQLKTIEVTHHKNWSGIIDSELTKITVFWDESNDFQHTNKEMAGMTNNTIRLPLTWQMEFDKQQLWISALEIQENGYTSYWADHLTVFFNKEQLEKYNNPIQKDSEPYTVS